MSQKIKKKNNNNNNNKILGVVVGASSLGIEVVGGLLYLILRKRRFILAIILWSNR